MYVIKAKRLDRTDRDMVEALAGVTGVLVAGATVEDSGQYREVDGIVLTSQGIWVIEGKGTRGRSGQVEAYANGPWSLDGDTSVFDADRPPNVQAATAAKIYGKQASVVCHRVVMVTGAGVTLAVDPVQLAGCWVTTPATLAQVVQTSGRPGGLSLGKARHALKVLGLGPNMPGDEVLVEAGFTAAPAQAADASTAPPTLKPRPDRPHTAAARPARPPDPNPRPSSRRQTAPVTRPAATPTWKPTPPLLQSSDPDALPLVADDHYNRSRPQRRRRLGEWGPALGLIAVVLLGLAAIEFREELGLFGSSNDHSPTQNARDRATGTWIGPSPATGQAGALTMVINPTDGSDLYAQGLAPDSAYPGTTGSWSDAATGCFGSVATVAAIGTGTVAITRTLDKASPPGCTSTGWTGTLAAGGLMLTGEDVAQPTTLRR